MTLDTTTRSDYDSERRLAEDIESFFLLNGYTWNINSEPTVPTAADIAEVIEKAKEYVADGGIIEIARLVIIKPKPEEELYDVYVHIGTSGE